MSEYGYNRLKCLSELLLFTKPIRWTLNHNNKLDCCNDLPCIWYYSKDKSDKCLIWYINYKNE
jgi:hypothetical protein